MKRLTLLIFITVLGGCGGGGLTGSSSPSIGLSASKSVVNYGESVTISWSTGEGASIYTGQCNFPISGDNGSITDIPSYDTTYRIRGEDADGNDVTKTKQVLVAKSTKAILLVGDAATSGTNQIREYLQTLTTQPVTISLAVPALTGYDAVVLLPSAAYISGDNAKVAAYLTSGGSVFLVEQAPRRLATGSFGSGDISAIGSWCAGVSSQSNPLSDQDVVETSPIGIPLSAVLFGDDCEGYAVGPVSALAIKLTTSSSTSSAFVYKPSSGGKVGYVGGLGIGSSAREATARELLLTEVRWGLDGS